MGEENLEKVYITNEIRIRKIVGSDLYVVETNIDDVCTSKELTYSELSMMAKSLSLMVFEHYNPNHHDLKPVGFKK